MSFPYSIHHYLIISLSLSLNPPWTQPRLLGDKLGRKVTHRHTEKPNSSLFAPVFSEIILCWFCWILFMASWGECCLARGHFDQNIIHTDITLVMIWSVFRNLLLNFDSACRRTRLHSPQNQKAFQQNQWLSKKPRSIQVFFLLYMRYYGFCFYFFILVCFYRSIEDFSRLQICCNVMMMWFD